ncbi:ADP-ribosylglycohydrolase family protein [Alicyclobacillus cycloheptanicus]|uniref:ADP-ribosylglycohydrolase n=1 Tax=Alicyclobacillus cycloheptanicus TaxID=1457 RepID=A0ABT9XHH8_9BACL|nr:ADP-ribosylglycohydrolase family protein [Alicyclobacillus cycloheptanicus]MDQ0189762.1 ADP-ribosylglycohydrolase [Alicyclobacillus cycloheptanicus]WDM01966.1 ADP-ribosylglycohydrolase family protein [Alicyclobacillus cycloheptanicus]
MSVPRRDRALGALYGLAIGDALGMPTQSLPRAMIVERYGPRIERFEPAPPDHPIASGLPAGSITDDTEQALLLAQLLVDANGAPDPHEFARRLVAWEADMQRRGSRDLLGPSTSRAIADLLGGADLQEVGRSGTTNGAAMRIAPVGICTPSDDVMALVNRVEAVSRITHHTGVALAGASAVAAAVSAGIDGADVAAATAAAIRAATLASGRGTWVAAADVATRIRFAVSAVAALDGSEDAAALIESLIGTSLATQESVPAAFAVLAVHPDDPWQACRLAASVGGDCDTIAAMAGAVAGACLGYRAFPAEARRIVTEVNHLRLEPLVDALLALRGAFDAEAAADADRRGAP